MQTVGLAVVAGAVVVGFVEVVVSLVEVVVGVAVVVAGTLVGDTPVPVKVKAKHAQPLLTLDASEAQPA